jgi:Tol biopolymer transport system component
MSSASPMPPESIRVDALTGRLLFARAGGQYQNETIFTADIRGSNERRITAYGDGCCPRWSPDGTEMLKSGLAADGERISTEILTAAGAEVRIVPIQSQRLNLGPGAWSSDGRRIAFQGWANSDLTLEGIYTANALDGSGLKRLTHGHDLPGDFSPDGRQLAFLRGDPSIEGLGTIFVINADGTGLRQITPDGFPAWYGSIRWAPDGARILFPTGGPNEDHSLWIVRPDGSGLSKIFTDPLGGFPRTPTWSPDGRYILFAIDPRDGAVEEGLTQNGLYVIRADGSGLTLLIGGKDHKREPDWTRA